MKKRSGVVIGIGIALLITVSAEFGWSQRGRRDRGGPVGLQTFSALPLAVRSPADNPSNPDKVALGRLLFWDPILSGEKDVSCGSCHHPEFGYAEDRDISIGVNGVGLGRGRRFAPANAIPFVKRNSQTILNTAFSGMDVQGSYDPSAAPMFWDVRARSLEKQALLPIATFEEMRGHAYSEEKAIDNVVARLKGIPEYRARFARAFGSGQAVTGDNVAKALAAFQRTLVANESPFDRYMRGEAGAMTAGQIRGMREFERTGCMNCHNGPMFSDYKLHVLSVPDNPRLEASDAGADKTYAFRTASLRNLAFTAPYMHSGVLATLEDVIEFYDDVRRRPRNANVTRRQLDPLLGRLRDPDRAEDELIAFLGALSDGSFDKTIPARVPSGLLPGGRIQ